jgi:hypothetical protein
MVRFGPKLEREQLLLGRFVDVAAELFAMATSCARASALRDDEAITLADYFCRTSRLHVANLFREVRANEDRLGYRVAQEILKSGR